MLPVPLKHKALVALVVVLILLVTTVAKPLVVPTQVLALVTLTNV